MHSIVGPDGNPQGKIDLRNRTITLRDASGSLVTMDLGTADVHIPSALPMYAAGYKLAAGVADTMSPVILVPKASDKYFTWDKDNAFQQVDSLAAGPAGSLPEVSTKLSNALFTTNEYVLASFVPTEVGSNADAPLVPEKKAMKRILDAMAIAREQRVATLLTTSINWDSSVVKAVAAGAKWNGGATSDPVADIHTILEKSLQPVTRIVMNERLYHTFVRNAQVQKFIASKINVPGLPQPDQITTNGALLGLPPIEISAMKAKNPTTGVYDYVLPDYCVLLHQPPGVPSSGEDISTSYTFRWTAGSENPDAVNTLSDGSVLYKGWTIRSFFDPKRGGRGGKMIVAVHNDAEVMTGNIVGGLITGCIQ